MTPTQEAAMRQALEALEFLSLDFFMLDPISPGREAGNKAITALRAALAEPVQEPVAWRYQDARGNYRYRGYVQGFDKEYSRLKPVPLYTAPTQRKPLTDEEILKAIGWDRAEMYMKLTPNFPVAEAKKETLKNARAIERAHGIGGQT